jgi:sortase A
MVNMKKLLTILAACALSLTLVSPALAAYNYDFGSGADSKSTFGHSTSTDEPVSPDPLSENTRRNKDNSALPPPYFYGSGDIPTDTGSPYHDNTPGGASGGVGGSAGSYGGDYGTGNNTNSGGSSVSVNLPDVPGFQSPTSTVAVNTEPLYYDNGSIGTIAIARTGKTITVYEGESLDNLKKGAGHFSGTSAWDGNVALCGHNRGNSAYFSFVKDMRTGDKVTYTTKYGVRVYEVISKEQIGEYDYSKLAWSAENILTLITCIENVPELRWAAVLREVR